MKTTNDLLQELGAERGWLVIADDRTWWMDTEGGYGLRTVTGEWRFYWAHCSPHEIIAVLKPCIRVSACREYLKKVKWMKRKEDCRYEVVYHIDLDGKPDTSAIQKRIEAAEKELAKAKKMLEGAQ